MTKNMKVSIPVYKQFIENYPYSVIRMSLKHPFVDKAWAIELVNELELKARLVSAGMLDWSYADVWAMTVLNEVTDCESKLNAIEAEFGTIKKVKTDIES